MCFAAVPTYNTADAETKFIIGKFYITVVVTMGRKTASMAAGTFQLVELESGDKRIIKIWCKGVVFFNE